jgi:hypothetical protein
MVERGTQLRAHPHDCRCGVCAAADATKPDKLLD